MWRPSALRIDLRAVLADERWDAGHCHVFLLHLYFPAQLYCPPFLPSILSPTTIIELSSAAGELPEPLQQSVVDPLSPFLCPRPPPQPWQLPSALFSCSDDAYVLYECVIALSQSLGCSSLLAQCADNLQAVCRASGRESAQHGLHLAASY